MTNTDAQTNILCADHIHVAGNGYDIEIWDAGDDWQAVGNYLDTEIDTIWNDCEGLTFDDVDGQILNVIYCADHNPMEGVIWYPDDMDTITELDSDEFGILYSVHVGLPLCDDVSVYVNDDDEELFPNDWQTKQPTTCKEMAEHEWRLGEEFAYC